LARHHFSLSPLAIRAFTPVFDGLCERVGARGPFPKLRLAERPPHPARKSAPTSPRKRGEVKAAAKCDCLACISAVLTFSPASPRQLRDLPVEQRKVTFQTRHCPARDLSCAPLWPGLAAARPAPLLSRPLSRTRSQVWRATRLDRSASRRCRGRPWPAGL
jgi:hypothetical protein